MRELPPCWQVCSLADVLLPASTTNPTKAGAGNFSYIDIEAVDNTRQRIVASRLIANAAAPSRARNAVHAGDVIVSLVRPYLKNIAIVPATLLNPVASTAFFVCRPGAGIDGRFLLYQLSQDAFITSITTYGSSPPSARDEEFERLAVLAAPASEQERIADTLDELFSDLDAAIAALERVRGKLKLYRASVLKAAIEGRLTADWREQHPDVEPASHLLQRILAERRRRWEEDRLAKYKAKGTAPPKNWKAKYKEPLGAPSHGLSALPDRWSWVAIAQLAEVGTGASM